MLHLVLHLNHSNSPLDAPFHFQNVLLYMFHLMPIESHGVAIIIITPREAKLLTQGQPAREQPGWDSAFHAFSALPVVPSCLKPTDLCWEGELEDVSREDFPIIP